MPESSLKLREYTVGSDPIRVFLRLIREPCLGALLCLDASLFRTEFLRLTGRSTGLGSRHVVLR